MNGTTEITASEIVNNNDEQLTTILNKLVYLNNRLLGSELSSFTEERMLVGLLPTVTKTYTSKLNSIDDLVTALIKEIG